MNVKLETSDVMLVPLVEERCPRCNRRKLTEHIYDNGPADDFTKKVDCGHCGAELTANEIYELFCVGA